MLQDIASLGLQSKSEGELKFSILSCEDGRISKVFEACDRLIESKAILNYEINETNLEDVFMICCEGEKEAVHSLAQSIEEIDRNSVHHN